MEALLRFEVDTVSHMNDVMSNSDDDETVYAPMVEQ